MTHQILKLNSKAPLSNLNSTSGEAYSLKIHLKNMLYLIFIPKMTLQDAQFKLMFLTNYFQN